MRFTKQTSKALPRFWRYYDKLPPDVQRQAKRKFLQFLESPSSVEFKRLNVAGLPPYYSARINDNYRAIGYLKKDTVYWIWIGNHDSYLQFIKGLD